MRIRSLSVILCAVLLLLGSSLTWAQGGPPASTPPPIRVACVGDSITVGAGNYPTTLARLLGDRYNVGNFGLSAQTALKDTGSSYWDCKQFTAAQAFAPQIVTIVLGTNDSKPGCWKLKDKFLADYMGLITAFQGLPTHPQVYVCLPVPAFSSNFTIDGKVIEEEIIPLIKEAAKQTNVPVIDLHTPLLGHPEVFPDGIHPNAEGARIIGEALFAQLTGAPSVSQPGGDFVGTLTVTLTPQHPDDVVRYTLDGSVPTDKSPRYDKPLAVTADARLTVQATAADGTTGWPISYTFTVVTPLPAVKTNTTSPGLAYAYYESDDTAALADPSKLTATATGTVAAFDLTQRKRDTNFAFVYTGYLTVPNDGVYTFATTSDDGSMLYIDGTLLVDNGGGHAAQTRDGTVPLAAGLHALRLLYDQEGGGFTLQVTWSTPTQPAADIPTSALCHEEK